MTGALKPRDRLMTIDVSLKPEPVEAEATAIPTPPFYRQPWFLMGAGCASLFFWPLAIIPAIAVWTGQVQFYFAPGKRIENEMAAKVVFTAICVTYMGWYGIKFVNVFGVPSCSDQRTIAVVNQIISEKSLGTFDGRMALFNVLFATLPPTSFDGFSVSAIRTVGTIPANGGYQCEAKVNLPVLGTNGYQQTFETSMHYTVEPIDRSDQIYVRLQLERVKF